jgi:hypothetical protein
MTFTSPNSVLWIHREFERGSGGVRAILYIVHFPDFYEGLWPLAEGRIQYLGIGG